MRVDIKVIANAKKGFLKEENGILKVYVTVPALEGKANKAVIRTLAQHFNVKKNQIGIIKGLQSQYKTINIEEF